MNSYELECGNGQDGNEEKIRHIEMVLSDVMMTRREIMLDRETRGVFISFAAFDTRLEYAVDRALCVLHETLLEQRYPIWWISIGRALRGVACRRRCM